MLTPQKAQVIVRKYEVEGVSFAAGGREDIYELLLAFVAGNVLNEAWVSNFLRNLRDLSLSIHMCEGRSLT